MIDIPYSRIFFINKSSEITKMDNGEKLTYRTLINYLD